MNKKTIKLILPILFTLATFFIIISITNKSYATETMGIINGTQYNIRNAGSGKYLNVNLGTDANGTNVIQWTKDGSTEQKFKLVYNSRGMYNLYPVCSTNNRVVDVLRVGGVSSGAISSGCNVDIWTTSSNAVDYNCQDFVITHVENGKYKIALKYNTNLVLTSVSTANGSGAGNTSTSAGNVIIQTYSASNNQQLWYFETLTNTKTIKTNSSMTNTQYNRTNAVCWALTYGVPNHPQSYFTYYNNGNCTNFVSQCLWYGNMSMMPSNPTPLITDREPSTSWFYTTDLARYSLEFAYMGCSR